MLRCIKRFSKNLPAFLKNPGHVREFFPRLECFLPHKTKNWSYFFVLESKERTTNKFLLVFWSKFFHPFELSFFAHNAPRFPFASLLELGLDARCHSEAYDVYSLASEVRPETESDCSW